MRMVLVFAFLRFLGGEVLADELPSDVKAENIRFKVFSREDMNGTFEMKDYHKTKPITFLTHGFTESGEGSMVQLIRDAYLPRDDRTVIAVDWSFYSGKNLHEYAVAAGNAIKVGPIVANYIKNNSLDLKNVLLVGFSLGGQISGIAAKSLHPEKLDKIVALDPAGVLFSAYPENKRLMPTDAKIVEVFHTSGGGLGFADAVGTRDFFPNTGNCPQPGCDNMVALVCSHSRAYYLFSEAIRNINGSYYAIKCDSEEAFRRKRCKVRGKAVILKLYNSNYDETIKGKFYFNTNDKEPFLIPLNKDHLGGNY